MRKAQGRQSRQGTKKMQKGRKQDERTLQRIGVQARVERLGACGRCAKKQGRQRRDAARQGRQWWQARGAYAREANHEPTII